MGAYDKAILKKVLPEDCCKEDPCNFSWEGEWVRNWPRVDSESQRRRDDYIKINFELLRGGGGHWEQRGISSKTLFFFFSWETPRQKYVESSNYIVEKFVVIAQAPIDQL